MRRKCLDCPRRIASGSRCPEHQRAKDRIKDARRGGHADWRDRAAAVNEHKARQGPWCPGYGVPGHWVLPPNRLSADHPVPLVRGGPLRPGWYNVLCISCQGRQGAELVRQVGGHR